MRRSRPTQFLYMLWRRAAAAYRRRSPETRLMLSSMREALGSGPVVVCVLVGVAVLGMSHSVTGANQSILIELGAGFAFIVPLVVVSAHVERAALPVRGLSRREARVAEYSVELFERYQHMKYIRRAIGLYSARSFVLAVSVGHSEIILCFGLLDGVDVTVLSGADGRVLRCWTGNEGARTWFEDLVDLCDTASLGHERLTIDTVAAAIGRALRVPLSQVEEGLSGTIAGSAVLIDGAQRVSIVFSSSGRAWCDDVETSIPDLNWRAAALRAPFERCGTLVKAICNTCSVAYGLMQEPIGWFAARHGPGPGPSGRSHAAMGKDAARFPCSTIA